MVSMIVVMNNVDSPLCVIMVLIVVMIQYTRKHTHLQCMCVPIASKYYIIIIISAQILYMYVQ